MELYRVVLDDGDEISISEENRKDYQADPEGFKQRYIEERKRQMMKWEQYKESLKALSPEEMEQLDKEIGKMLLEMDKEKENEEKNKKV